VVVKSPSLKSPSLKMMSLVENDIFPTDLIGGYSNQTVISDSKDDIAEDIFSPRKLSNKNEERSSKLYNSSYNPRTENFTVPNKYSIPLNQSYDPSPLRRNTMNIKESLRVLQSTQESLLSSSHDSEYDEKTINEKFDHLFKQPRNEFDETSTAYSPLENSSYIKSYRPYGRPIWEQDKSRDCCSRCSKNFTFFRRRHHCRKCGKLFCSECCHNKFSLLQLNYSIPVLVCNYCVNNLPEPVLVLN
jgi:hypothetical protein